MRVRHKQTGVVYEKAEKVTDPVSLALVWRVCTEDGEIRWWGGDMLETLNGDAGDVRWEDVTAECDLLDDDDTVVYERDRGIVLRVVGDHNRRDGQPRGYRLRKIQPLGALTSGPIYAFIIERKVRE